MLGLMGAAVAVLGDISKRQHNVADASYALFLGSLLHQNLRGVMGSTNQKMQLKSEYAISLNDFGKVRICSKQFPNALSKRQMLYTMLSPCLSCPLLFIAPLNFHFSIALND
jgi:hypothetical protein